MCVMTGRTQSIAHSMVRKEVWWDAHPQEVTRSSLLAHVLDLPRKVQAVDPEAVLKSRTTDKLTMGPMS